MDPVEKLFRDLPNPIKLDALYQQRFLQVIQSFNPSGSRDPDRHFLATLVKDYTSGKIEVLGMLSELGYFAEKAQILDNDSAKSYQLKAFRWIFNGRKDEDYPFNNNIQGRSEQDDDTEKPNSHVFLPAKLTDTQICASCGKTDAKLACSGCLARLDSHAIMKVSYCNKSCQTRHWKEHKPQCLGRKMIWRAASLIRDIFNMFQKKACPKTGVVSIVDKQGFVHLIREDFEDFEERGLQGKPIIYSFPSDLASSEEHALAAVMDSECTQFLIDFHDFLELLILREF
ncbi:hypothetical protein F4777DRAFT_564828 [Nemania sp. FL0916]|nr:hypothetical protein F4777DRAFT_564828 [Nemania sp. FL0916]